MFASSSLFSASLSVTLILLCDDFSIVLIILKLNTPDSRSFSELPFPLRIYIPSSFSFSLLSVLKWSSLSSDKELFLFKIEVGSGFFSSVFASLFNPSSLSIRLLSERAQLELSNSDDYSSLIGYVFLANFGWSISSPDANET